MKRPVKCFEYGGSVLTCVKFQIGSTQSCLGPGSVKKEKGKNQRAKRTKGVDRLDWEGGKPAALSPSLIQQDKTRQCFIWSLIQSYVHRLYPNHLKS